MRSILALALAGTLAFAATARAQWVERPFDPPTGSRWIIQSDVTTENNRNGRLQTIVVKTTSELTFEQKIADGFRISYVLRSAALESDAETTALLGPPSKAFENVVIHATTGPNGMPLRVENLDEVLAVAQKMIDGLSGAFSDKPEVAGAMRQMFTGMLIADDSRAPRFYLGDLALLALGQNTGLQQGEIRRSIEETPNPFGSGAPIKSSTTLRIDSADPGIGNVRLLSTHALDPDAIKEVMRAMYKQAGAPQQVIDRVIEQTTFIFDSRTEIDVEEGITRAVRHDEKTTINAADRRTIKHQRKLVTVTRAP
jgi:hypothetical protein